MGIADNISGAFESVGDTISDWASGGSSTTGASKVLSYPVTLGDDSSVDFNDSTDIGNDVDAYGRKSSTAAESNTTSDPFILFEMLRIQEDSKDTKLKETKSLTDGIDIKLADAVDVDKLKAHAKKLGSNIQETMAAWVPNRIIQTSIAMYMPPAFAVADTMSYEEKTRKALNTFDSLLNANAQSAEDATTLGIETSAAVLGGIGTLAGKIPGLKSIGGAVGGVTGIATGSVIADEAQRIRGKVMDPSEYKAFKSTGLRSFSFTWKMLPESKAESEECKELIKAFRASAHAHKPEGGITLHVPDQVIVTFHGVSGLVKLPPLFMDSVSVTFNPSSQSFFMDNGAPVEIDLTVSLTEIMPIYRTDVDKGY